MATHRAGPARELVRIDAGSHWFPDTVFEVVAHSDDQFIAVTVTTTSAGGGAAHLEQFQCEQAATCRRKFRDWLVVLALRLALVDPRVARWADHVAGRIVDAALDSPVAGD